VEHGSKSENLLGKNKNGLETCKKILRRFSDFELGPTFFYA